MTSIYQCFQKTDLTESVFNKVNLHVVATYQFNKLGSKMVFQDLLYVI